MSLKLMYITNKPEVALIAEKYGVDRIWIDLESDGKEKRQKGRNSVKSNHTVEDIKNITPLLKSSEMLVRINPWNDKSKREIEEVIEAGADIIMLPMWKTAGEVQDFVYEVNSRCKTVLLLETREAAESLDEVLELRSEGTCIFDEIHIGLNDLHLSYGLTFMFELLSNGTVERICNKLKANKLPYGFGGIAGIGSGDIPAEKIILEHYRLGSTRAILSRSFCEYTKIGSIEEIDIIFRENMKKLRSFENGINQSDDSRFEKNKETLAKDISSVVKKMKNR